MNSTEQESLYEEHIRFSSYVLYGILKNNNMDVNNDLFKQIWNKLNADITVAQLLDTYIHKTEFILMFEKYDLKELSVFWKNNDFDKNIGDLILGDKIINIFTFTVWAVKNDKENST